MNLIERIRTMPWNLLRQEDGSMGIAKTQITSPQIQSSGGGSSSSLDTGQLDLDVWSTENSGQGYTGFWGGSWSAVTVPGAPLLLIGTSNAIQPTATQYMGTNLVSAATATSSAGLVPQSSAGTGMVLGLLRRVRWRFQLVQTTQIRAWVGVSAYPQASGVQYQTDTPTIAFASFRFSTNAGDTTWVAGVGSGANRVFSATAIVPDANIHNFEIRYDTAQLTYYIDNQLVATIGNTIATPTNSTGLLPHAVVDNVGVAQTRQMNYFYLKGISVKL